MRHIAILLTVFNRKECTLQCLRQLREQEWPREVAYDVYITDGGSTDGTVEAVRRHFPEADIEVREGVYWNRGMYHSWQRAAERRDYDAYLWLNDDTYLYPQAVARLMASADETDGRCIIVGATVDTATRQRVTYGGRLKGKGISPLTGALTPVDHFNGNIVLVPSAVHRRLGNLDYYYTHSKGDFDYGIRAGKAGIGICQCGVALGECDLHPRIDRWCDPAVPLRKRWAMLHRPNGMPPRETFHLERQTSLPLALLHYCTILLRCLVPSLWVWTGKAKVSEG